MDLDSVLGPQNNSLASKQKCRSEYTGPLVAVMGDETQIKIDGLCAPSKAFRKIHGINFNMEQIKQRDRRFLKAGIRETQNKACYCFSSLLANTRH